MSQIGVVSKFSPLPINPTRYQNLPVDRRASCSGGKAVCFAGGFVSGRESKVGSLGRGWIGGRVHEGMFVMNERKEGDAKGKSVVCAAELFSPQTLHWISAVSSVILLFTRDVGIRKSFLVPLFALQAPTNVISWIKSEYGMWTAFLALLVRLFYPLPGEVELPLMAMLLAAVSPTQTMNLRGTPAAAIISLVIAGYLAYQHFSKPGSVEGAFDSKSIVPTLSLLGTLIPPFLLLFLY